MPYRSGLGSGVKQGEEEKREKNGREEEKEEEEEESESISYIILEAVCSVPPCVFRHKFYIQLPLPISPIIMGGF